MNRFRRFTLLGLAVVVCAAGCGGDEPPTLQEWASSVCAAYDGYVTPEVKGGSKRLESLYWAAFGVSGPDAVDPKNFPKPRKNAPTIISQDLLLTEIANVDAAHRNVIGKLEALERPPDTEAGRLAGSILDDEIRKIHEHLDYLHEETEKAVRETYSREPTPKEALTMLSLVQSTNLDPFIGADNMAYIVGLAAVVREQTGGELAQAFKAADGCQSWRKPIEDSERANRHLKP